MEEEKWQKVIDTLNEIDISDLTDEQLKCYYVWCYDDSLSCMREARKRNMDI